MKKTIQIILLLIVIFLATLWSLRSIRDREISPPQEAGAAFSTRKSVESTCAKEATSRTEKKFDEDATFDTKTEEYLRTYWHTNYYEACLFDNGYNGDGTVRSKTTIHDEEGVKKYTNHSMNITFDLTGDVDLIYDNDSNPDFDKLLYTSLLQKDDQSIGIQVRKDFVHSVDVTSIFDIEDAVNRIFFTESNIVRKTATTSPHGVEILEIQQDDALFGIAFLTPEKNLVYIYGKFLPQETLKTIIDTLSFPNP